MLCETFRHTLAKRGMLPQIIKLSELWNGLSLVTIGDLHCLSEFEDLNEHAIGDAWERHYYSYAYIDGYAYAADAIWDAVFVVAYRKFITMQQRERGLRVFQDVFNANVRSLVDILVTVANASDGDFVALSEAWADINDYGESASYQEAIQACVFPFSGEIADLISDEETVLIRSAVNNLLIAGNSAIPVTAEDYKVMIEPVWHLVS